MTIIAKTLLLLLLFFSKILIIQNFWILIKFLEIIPVFIDNHEFTPLISQAFTFVLGRAGNGNLQMGGAGELLCMGLGVGRCVVV